MKKMNYLKSFLVVLLLCLIGTFPIKAKAAESPAWEALKDMKLYEVEKAETSAVTLAQAAKETDLIMLVFGRVGEAFCGYCGATVVDMDIYAAGCSKVRLKVYILDIQNDRDTVPSSTNLGNAMEHVEFCSYSKDNYYYNDALWNAASKMGLPNSINIPVKALFSSAGKLYSVKTGYDQAATEADLNAAVADVLANVSTPTPSPAPVPVQKAQTITATTSYTKTVGAAAFSLKARTNGNGKLSYISSNTKVAAVSSSGTVTLKGVGKANITITAAATSTYKKATKTVAIKVNPKGTTLGKLTNSKTRKLQITWKKKTGISGYQIQYARDKSFKKQAAFKKITKAGTTKYTVKNLAKKKTYYVRVRTYKRVNGQDYYSSWSGKKAIRIVK